MRSRSIDVCINLDRVRENAERIVAETGVELIAVIKADAYGLGAARVAEALAAVADDFAFFSLAEARQIGRPGLVIGPPDGGPAEYRELGLTPSIFTLEDARRFAEIPVALALDTGMQRFGMPREHWDEALRICTPRDILSHALRSDAAEVVNSVRGTRDWRRHVACTALLPHKEAWLDAVRPGVALYRGAVRVATRLISVTDTYGPAGYTSFNAARIGIILGGYAHGLASATVLVNGAPQRLIEVGMNSSFVTCAAGDHAGDEVVLLGDRLAEAQLAGELSIREHEVLCRYTGFGPRRYLPEGKVSSCASAACAKAGEPVPSAIPRQTGENAATVIPAHAGTHREVKAPKRPRSPA